MHGLFFTDPADNISSSVYKARKPSPAGSSASSYMMRIMTFRFFYSGLCNPVSELIEYLLTYRAGV